MEGLRRLERFVQFERLVKLVFGFMECMEKVDRKFLGIVGCIYFVIWKIYLQIFSVYNLFQGLNFLFFDLFLQVGIFVL